MIINSNKLCKNIDKFLKEQIMDNYHRRTGTGSQMVPRRKAGASLDRKSEDIYRIRCSHIGSARGDRIGERHVHLQSD